MTTPTTTSPAPERKKKGPPALASRILAIGVSAAATLGMIGAMAAADAEASEPAPTVATEGSSRPQKIIVVIRSGSAQASAGRDAPPAIAQRAAPARAVTSSHAS